MAKTPLKKIILVAGSDEMRVKERALALSRELTPPGDLSLEICDGWVETVDDALATIRKTLESLQTMGFFSAEKLVWLKNAAFLADGPLAKSEEVQESIASLLDCAKRGMPEGIKLLISVPNIDKRRVFYKQMEDLATVELCDAPTARRDDADRAAGDWVEGLFREAGKKCRSAAADRLVELCGGDLRVLRNEVEKTLLYAGDEPQITEEHVDAIVSPTREEDLWAWCDAVMDGKVERALKLLKQLEFQREEPVGLLANLAGNARLALQCAVLLDKGWLKRQGDYKSSWTPEAEEIFVRNKDGGLPHSFRITKMTKQVSGKPLTHWVRILELVHRTYATFFDGSSGEDPFRKLELLTMRIAPSR